jgi:hypothetical protein
MNTCSVTPATPLPGCVPDRGFNIPDADLARMKIFANRIQMISGCSEDQAQGAAVDYYFNFGML